ncbi:hypothetical protein [Loktanella sp. S4079]|uniref:hypothetical protein n=1 Tax=Loktanella sp. S4079 TaxID=579483 RepID=UPI0005FA81B2|nr:hypothetical protein [Loktanella sp. S4079]KJZ18258.1 hypothetical protein TW80_15085 [Loktanella sp. S4079]
MKTQVTRLLQDDDGAVTVDFVVLTAAIATLGLTVVTQFTGGATSLANEIETAIDEMNAGQSSS